MVRRRSRRRKGVFVFAVVGEAHVTRLATPLRFLKQFSQAEIIVIQSRSGQRAAHDQTIEITLPDNLDDHQASLFLKTNLHSYLDQPKNVYCYLDSDVIAVRDDVDTIFNYLEGPVRFARDHVDIDTFSRWAVHCGCAQGRCGHLRDELRRSFDVDVPEGDWRPWNGGVFLFDAKSHPFLDMWHALTVRILGNARWRTRDQGTLAAAAWKLGLQDLEPLDERFNFIVDRMRGIPPPKRPAASIADFHLRDDYVLDNKPGRLQPRLIHFINNGVDQKGWRHWDEVAELLR